MADLKEYRSKRNFKKTKEPGGEGKSNGHRGGLIYVVQKHDASRLHYDLRLEWNGTLLSWAVPKGPSPNPADKRLAVMVEDHPVDYADFEGTIPKGQYGGGTVIVWDRGSWTPIGNEDPATSLKKGRLKFELQGEKLKGQWALARMKSKEDNQWLLMKHKDEYAESNGSKPIVEEQPDSVKTGRDLKTVSAGKTSQSKKEVSDGVRLKEPDFLEMELAQLVKEAPKEEGWLNEIKFDGYRIQASKRKESIKLLSRNNKDWTSRFKGLTGPMQSCADDFILDGEVVALDKEGRSSFQKLQESIKAKTSENLYYYVFDLLWLNGKDLRKLSLRKRKEILNDLLNTTALNENGIIRFSDHLEGNGDTFFKQACEQSLEGIICKRAESKYHGKRSRDWVKVKCENRQEFVICGFTEPSGSRVGFGALLLGVYRANGNLYYAGKVGTGFNDRSLREIHKKLKSLTTKKPVLSEAPTGSEFSNVTWTKAKLLAEVSFAEWTKDKHLRHPSFKGLREDKNPEQVREEKPLSTPAKGSSEKKTRTKGKNDSMEIGGVKISHPDRAVFPEEGFSKGEVAEYYQSVAKELLPYVADRPLSIVRCPEGRQKKCFYQKHHSQGMESVVGKVPVKEKQGKADYLTIKTEEELISLVQFGMLEIHPWLSKNDRLDRPDHLVFDLDPAKGVSTEEIFGAGFLLRDILKEYDLESFPKITGGKGLHVVVPVTRRYDFETTKPFCKAIASELEKQNPDKFLITASKAQRKGKIFIDYLRNGSGATAVAPFSLRARSGATAAVPVKWNEFSGDLKTDKYNLKTLPQRLKQLRGDPWENYFQCNQTIKAAVLKKLGVRG